MPFDPTTLIFEHLFLTVKVARLHGELESHEVFEFEYRVKEVLHLFSTKWLSDLFMTYRPGPSGRYKVIAAFVNSGEFP